MNTNQHKALGQDFQIGTHASEEGEIWEITVVQQSCLVLWHPITDLLCGVDLWGATF